MFGNFKYSNKNTIQISNVSSSSPSAFYQKTFGKLKKMQKQSQPEGEVTQKKLVLMWTLMFLGYFMFVVQWYSISNFSSGWGKAFYGDSGASVLVGSVPNWIITLGRGIGSMLAGFFIAKLGHKYAVVFCLSLMVVAFPYIIVAQNEGWNSLSNAGGTSLASDSDGYQTAVAGFSLFVIFRIFLAIGGTTLITYTNSVIAKMSANQKSKYMTLNSFAFNTGAFLGNIFFVIPAVRSGVSNGPVWTGILSAFIAIIAVIDILYILFSVEVVGKELKRTKTFSEKDQWTFTRVLKLKENYVLYLFYALWLVAVVYSNQGAFRNFIEESPGNLQTLVNWDLKNNETVTSISKSDYAFVWPLFISLFVISYFVSTLTVTKFNRTNFDRKSYIATMLVLGFVFMFIGFMLVYFCGYGNTAALVFFLIFAFISGVFLWGAQPIILFIPQQQSQSNPQYVGTAAGLVWGLGYLGYTVCDACVSSIGSYAGKTTFVTEVKNQVASGTASAVQTESGGLIAVFVIFWVLMLGSLLLIKFLPSTGIKNKDGVFRPFKEKFNPFNISHWGFIVNTNDAK